MAGEDGDDGVTLLIMAGGPTSSEVERWLTATRLALALDLAERAAEIPAIERIILVTPPGLEPPTTPKLLWEPSPESKPGSEGFHFGQMLWGLIAREGIEALIYFSGGSGALLPAEELEELAARLARAVRRGERLALVNNFYSTDFAALTPATALLELPPPARDNRLGWLLADYGLNPLELERGAATQFDVDTPTDLGVLKLYAAHDPELPGRRTRSLLESLPLGTRPLEAVLDRLTDPEATILVAGRVGAHVWRYLERETACRVRVFSEERGMEALGRAESGPVRSLLGFYLEEIGPERFFTRLAELAELAILDTRVIFAHLGLRLSPADRFYSDLLRPESIQDEVLREFTAAAARAPLPVILGGHSLVSGGLYALVELAWAAARTRIGFLGGSHRYRNHREVGLKWSRSGKGRGRAV